VLTQNYCRKIGAVLHLLCFFLLVSLVPSVAFAKTETFSATYTYTMNDNDSKNDARRLAYSEARKLVLEKAGSFFKSAPQVQDNSISQEDIKSYIGALVNVEIDKEKFDASFGSQNLTMTVKAAIDTEPLITTLAIIRSDIELQKKVIKEQRQLRELEVKLNTIQKNLYAENKSESALYIKKTRADVLSKISENNSEVVSEIDKLQNNLNIISDKVMKNVRNGMTRQELADMLGKYRQSASFNTNNKYLFCQNYGKYWLILDSNIVIGYVTYFDYKGCNPETVKQLIAFKELVQ